MGGKKNSKDEVNDESAESVHSSDEAEEEDYVVEKVMNKRKVKGKVSFILKFYSLFFQILLNRVIFYSTQRLNI